MIVDARSLQENKIIETDVCIVGAGTAGLTLTHELIEQDFRICLLESGGLKPDQETQALAMGENIGHPYFSLDTARIRCLGGTSTRSDIAIAIIILVRGCDPLTRSILKKEIGYRIVAGRSQNRI